MMPIITETFEVTGVKKTKAEFFEDVEVGDILRVEVPLTTARYATAVTITNVRTGAKREDVASRIGSGLAHLKYRRHIA